MKPFFFTILFLFSAGIYSAGIFAAPLEGGFAYAPKFSASSEEKSRIFAEARTKVIETAARYENTPYLYGGATRSGLDCSGFIYVSFKDALGVSVPRTSTGLYTWTERIPSDQVQPGDLLFFKTDSTGKISHVGLYLGDGRFIHSTSAGPKTGVIYSNFDDRYWSRTFAGAGRAFPETSGFRPGIDAVTPADFRIAEAETSPSAGRGRSDLPPAKTDASSSSKNSRLLLGVAVAPTWAGFLKEQDLLRGVASQFRIAVDTYTFGMRMVFGLEIRPEYDGALGVFRIPITLSWGPNDKIAIFLGPVFSFGEPAITTEEGTRVYSGGTNWIGAAGLTAAPFIFKTDAGEFAPYLEAAWQYYVNEENTRNANADFSAGFRFSTGLRWSIQVK
ncbi:MAG: C40 family peptidase [Treponema sp.]|jgi:probable lipoprotein NlpC|nr:C40 family peptidase [Treponema sp.]